MGAKHERKDAGCAALIPSSQWYHHDEGRYG